VNRASLLTLALGAAMVAGPPRVRAQSERTADEEAFEASLSDGGSLEGADAWEQPTILVVARPNTPEVVVRDLRALLEQTGAQLRDPAGYEREARSRGLPPESPEAMQAVLPDMHPDLDLVIVVGVNRPTRPTLVGLTYHDRYGLQILEEEHSLRGGVMTDEARTRTLAETRLALAVITRPPGGLQQVAGGIAPGQRTPGLALHVAVEAGAGFGTREFSLPTPLGVIRLATATFPAAALELAIDVEPTARGRLALGADLEYQTSLGLVTTDRRIDMTERETNSRSQRLAALLRVAYRLEDALSGISLAASLGWSVLSFTSEAPVTLPDYALQGPVLTLAVVVPIGAGLLTLMIGPEATWIVDVGKALGNLGVSSMGVAIGGWARIRVRLLQELFGEIAYRESHAFLDTEGGGATDVERFATLRVVYRP